MASGELIEKANWLQMECGACFKQYVPNVHEGIVVLVCPKCGDYQHQTKLQARKED